MKKNMALILSLVLFLMAGISYASDMGTDEIAQQGAPEHHMAKKPMGPGPQNMQGPTMQRNKFFPGPMSRTNHRQMIMRSYLLAPPVISALNLSDDQVARLEKMRDDDAKRNIDMGASLAKAGIDLRTLMNAKDLNINAIQAQMQKMADIRVQMQVSHLKSYEQAKTVLTPEQRAKLDQIWKEGPAGVMKKKQGAGNPDCMELGITMEEIPEGFPVE